MTIEREWEIWRDELYAFAAELSDNYYNTPTWKKWLRRLIRWIKPKRRIMGVTKEEFSRMYLVAGRERPIFDKPQTFRAGVAVRPDRGMREKNLNDLAK